MFIPYGTDTPIYHWPIVTGVMMFINIVALVVTMNFPELAENGVLWHGDGIHPLQWLTSNFIHDGVVHLIISLVFLFIFGIIVEGKLGSWKFTLIYLGMGIFQCMAIQLLCQWNEPCVTFGASAAIYGLMMISVVWAPQDNVKVLLLVRSLLSMFRGSAHFFNIPIGMVALFYFLIDFSIAFFSGFQMDIALFSIIGAMLGFGIGLTFIFFHWVDGEQRDLISMILELFGKKPIKKKKTKTELREEQKAKKAELLAKKKNIILYWRSIEAHLAAGNPTAASQTFRQIRKVKRNAVWDEPNLLKLISLYQKHENWDQVIELSRLYVQQYQGHTPVVVLNLAKVLLLQKDAPRKTLKAMSLITNPNAMTEKQKSEFKKIVSKANQMINAGAIELD